MHHMIKTIKNYVMTRKVIFLLVFVFFLIRLPFLENTFLLYDERDIALTQYSLAKTGMDLYGSKTPLSFDHISPHAPVVAMYYGVPFWLLGVPKTIAMARFIYLLPFSIVPLLIFELIYALSKRKNLSILTTAIFSFSPWIYHASRLALEANLAFPLFLGAMLAQLKKKVWISAVLYFIAFFSYQGIRPVIPLVVVYISFFSLLQKERIKNILVRTIFLMAVFVIAFGLGSMIESTSRNRGTSEILFLNSFRLGQEVDFNRFISQSPQIIKPIFDNKLTITLDYAFKNFLQGLNLSYLFGTGDYVPIYSNGVAGQFYPIFLVFLLSGLMALGKTRTKEYFYIAGLTLIGLIPSIINIYSVTFSIRSLLSGVGISFIIACGILEVYIYLQVFPRLVGKGIKILILFIILFQAVSFLYKYSFQRPTLQSELYNEHERTLAQYLRKSNSPYTIRTNNAFSHYLSYLFLSDLTSKDLEAVQKTLRGSKTDFKYGNIVFAECKPKETAFTKKPKQEIIDQECLTDSTQQTIKLQNMQFDRINYADYNYLDVNKRIKYYVFN